MSRRVNFPKMENTLNKRNRVSLPAGSRLSEGISKFVSFSERASFGVPGIFKGLLRLQNILCITCERQYVEI